RLATSEPGTALPALTELVRRACQRPAEEAQSNSPAAAGPRPNGIASWNPSPDYLRSVARVMTDAADALEHAHREGYLHPHVKPSNIMVDLRGHCWVVDFGLAPLRDPGAGIASGSGANGHAGVVDTVVTVPEGEPAPRPDPEVERYQAALTTGTVGTREYMAP